MGNAFMPSVAASLNQGSRNSLLEIMQQRLLEQEMQKQLFAQQRQGQMDAFSMGSRIQSQRLAQDRFNATEAERTRDREAAARKEAAAARKAENERAVALMAGEHIKSGQATRASIAPMAMQSGGRVQSWMVPEAKETPEERDRRLSTDEVSRAKGKAEALKKYPELKPTKAAKEPKGPKDSPTLPMGVKAAIRSKIDSKAPGWGTPEEAYAAVSKSWSAFLRDHPDLDRGAVIKFIGNQYNEHLTPSKAGKEDSSGLGAGALDRINAMRAAKGLPPL